MSNTKVTQRFLFVHTQLFYYLFSLCSQNIIVSKLHQSDVDIIEAMTWNCYWIDVTQIPQEGRQVGGREIFRWEAGIKWKTFPLMLDPSRGAKLIKSK